MYNKMSDKDTKASSDSSRDSEGCCSDVSIESLSGWVHIHMQELFVTIAEKVVKYPFSTIALTLFCTVALAQGIWVYDEELAANKQFTPQDSRAIKEGDWVMDTFDSEASRAGIFFVSSDNILTSENLLFMNKHHSWITTQLVTTYNNEPVSWVTQCDKRPTTGICRETPSILSLWDYNDTIINQQQDQFTVNSQAWRVMQPSGPDVAYYLSGVEYYSGTTNIKSAKAARITYRVRNKKKEINGEGLSDPESSEFQIQMSEQTRDFWDTSASGKPLNLRLYPLTPADQKKAESKALKGDVRSLIIGYALTVMYTCFVLYWKVKQPLLGLVSVLSVGLSTISSYGLCWLIGIKFNKVVQVLILILLGIGVDDTFVIMDSWASLSKVADKKERMITALRHAGPAITVTSITDLVAFLSGSSTSLPALRDFCYYAAFGILFDFAYQCTFFVAIAYFSSLRQESYNCCCIPRSDSEDEPGDEKSLPEDSPKRGVATKYLHAVTKFLVGGTGGRVLVITISAVFLALGIWGCTNVKMDFDKEWFVPSNAPIQDAFDVRDEYFTRSDIPASVYFGEVDYSSLEVQRELNLTVDLMQSNTWVVSDSVSSWYLDFHRWVVYKYPGDILDGGGVHSASFNRLLREFTGWNLTSPGPAEFEKYQKNIAWEESNALGSIKGSSISFLMSGRASEEGQLAVDCMRSLRNSVIPVSPAFVWSNPFVFWSSYEVMLEEVTRNVLVACACVFVLVTLLVANLAIGVIVVIAIGCVDVCMLGFMTHFGVTVNSVSVVCIVVAIGLAVDYSVHIGHSYLTATAEDKPYGTAYQQRAGYAIAKMGPAVLNGALSTFLAILPLAFAKSYVFSVFFKMFTIIIGFGVWFGVFGLPVLLSFIGPAPFSGSPEIPRHSNPFLSEEDVENEIKEEEATQQKELREMYVSPPAIAGLGKGLPAYNNREVPPSFNVPKGHASPFSR